MARYHCVPHCANQSAVHEYISACDEFVTTNYCPSQKTVKYQNCDPRGEGNNQDGGLVSRHYSLWGQIRVAGPGPSWHETGNSRPVIVFVLLVIIIVIHSSSSCHHRHCHLRSSIVCIILVIMYLCNIVFIIAHCCALFIFILLYFSFLGMLKYRW